EVDLDENQEVLLTLDDQYWPPTDPGGLSKSAGVSADVVEDSEEFVSAAGGWIGQFDDFDELIRDIYQARIDGSRERHDI
ncbi:MAG: hypothetical protein OXH38_10485, partial [Chloroflexi bacterium]|nr:hypothetical protein [Chloroflexota bacterium]